MPRNLNVDDLYVMVISPEIMDMETACEVEPRQVVDDGSEDEEEDTLFVDIANHFETLPEIVTRAEKRTRVIYRGEPRSIIKTALKKVHHNFLIVAELMLGLDVERQYYDDQVIIAAARLASLIFKRSKDAEAVMRIFDILDKKITNDISKLRKPVYPYNRKPSQGAFSPHAKNDEARQSQYIGRLYVNARAYFEAAAVHKPSDSLLAEKLNARAIAASKALAENGEVDDFRNWLECVICSCLMPKKFPGAALIVAEAYYNFCAVATRQIEKNIGSKHSAVFCQYLEDASIVDSLIISNLYGDIKIGGHNLAEFAAEMFEERLNILREKDPIIAQTFLHKALNKYSDCDAEGSLNAWGLDVIIKLIKQKLSEEKAESSQPLHPRGDLAHKLMTSVSYICISPENRAVSAHEKLTP